jgi:transcriptional regulator with XRE-family HTH domain
MKKDPKKVFGERVRALRQAANLSQEELAEACGLQYVCRGCRTRGTQYKPFEYNRSISSIKD